MEIYPLETPPFLLVTQLGSRKDSPKGKLSLDGDCYTDLHIRFDKTGTGRIITNAHLAFCLHDWKNYPSLPI